MLKVLTRSLKCNNIETNTTDTIVFDKIVVNQPAIDWFMHFLKPSTSTTSLLNHLKSGTAVGVSDGSCYPHNRVGSCDWIVATPNGKEWIKDGGLISGTPDDQSAYRSELGGNWYCLLYIINHVTSLF